MFDPCVPALSALGATTFHSAFAADNNPDDMAAYLAAAFGPSQQAAELADPRATFFIAEIEGQVVGYAKLLASDPPVHGRFPAPVRSGPVPVVDLPANRPRHRLTRSLWLVPRAQLRQDADISYRR